MAFFRKWGLSIGMLIVIIGTFSYGIYKRKKFMQDHALVQLQAIQVPNGWGYDILRDGHVYFHQTIIPAVPGKRVFRTKEDALAVGGLFFDKIKAGQPPIITLAEIDSLHVYIPPDLTGAADSARYVDSVRVAMAAAAAVKAKAKARDSVKKTK